MLKNFYLLVFSLICWSLLVYFSAFYEHDIYPSSYALFLVVLIIKPIFKLISYLKLSSFKVTKRKGVHQVHMSIFARIDKLDKPKLRAFKRDLNEVVKKSLNSGCHTIIIRSHIMTDFRLKELMVAISRSHPDLKLKLASSTIKTKAIERYILRFYFLLIEWRFVEVSSESLEVKISYQ